MALAVDELQVHMRCQAPGAPGFSFLDGLSSPRRGGEIHPQQPDLQHPRDPPPAQRVRPCSPLTLDFPFPQSFEDIRFFANPTRARPTVSAYSHIEQASDYPQLVVTA